jgi:histone deacetylase 6
METSLRRGQKWHKLGRYQKAIGCFNEALSRNGSNAHTHYLQGRSFHALFQFQNAILCYEKAIKLDSIFEKAYVMKGIALYDSNRIHSALTWFEKTIEQHPRFALAKNSQIRSLITINRVEKLKKGIRTGIVYDTRMALHEDPNDPVHPECPERLYAISKAIQEHGYYDVCERVDPREATDAELSLVHSQQVIHKVKNIGPEVSIPSDNYYNEHTSTAALLATGSLVELCDRVMSGELDNGFAVIRPPGHHANATHPSGFCFFNNVAVAARSMQQKHGIERVLIVDWDVHHGNGTQDIFENDPSVLFFSSHRGEFYPNQGEIEEVGKGNLVNVPFVNGPYGDGDMLHVFHSILLPIAIEFKPQLVIVSAGFDAVEEDPLGEMEMSPQVFGHLTHLLKTLAGGKIVLALEGGYNLKQIPKCVLECLQVLKGAAPSPLPKNKNQLREEHRSLMQEIRQTQAKTWTSLQ